MKTKNYCLVAGIMFGLVAIGHAARLTFHLPLYIGGMVVPMWVSWCGVVATTVLAACGFAASSRG